MFFCYFPFFVCFLFSASIFQHKKKNTIFFSKTSFLITQNFAKTLFWHTVTLFVLQKKPKNTIKLGKTAKKNLDQFLTYNLDQFLTYKTPNLGPVFNFTAYIYINIQTDLGQWLLQFTLDIDFWQIPTKGVAESTFGNFGFRKFLIVVTSLLACKT